MTRVIVADGCHQLDSPVTGRRYYAKGARALEGSVRGGVFDVHPADAAMAVKMGGAIVPVGGVTTGGHGYRCGHCRFVGYFPGPCPRRDSRGCGDGEMTAEGAPP